MFTAEKFDPDEWAELFKNAGAKFAGPVGEHHDGFSMWDTSFSDWNATKMGPMRNVVKELELAIRKQNLRFLVALHHAENWWFFPHWRKEFDTSDPRYSGLYGQLHNQECVQEPFSGEKSGRGLGITGRSARQTQQGISGYVAWQDQGGHRQIPS